MSASRPTTDRCDTEGHCITCSDEGVPMRVETLNAETGLAVCVDGDGRRTDVLTDLVPNTRPGDQLLVHAGTALLRLESSTEAPA